MLFLKKFLIELYSLDFYAFPIGKKKGFLLFTFSNFAMISIVIKMYISWRVYRNISH